MANVTKQKKSRLFTFGCSFTMYAWPTYADFLAHNFDHYENWAYPGLGNRAIAERIAECHTKNIFTENDTVIVQWSTHIRNDYHTFVPMQFDPNSFLHVWFRENNNIGWKTQGSIFNPNNRQFVYDDKWVQTFWDEQSYLMYSLNDMLLTQGLLESTGCIWRMTSIGDFSKMCTDIPNATDENISDQDNIYNNENFKIYKDVLEHKNFLEPIGTFSWKDPSKSYEFVSQQGPWLEVHPSHTQHLDYVKEVLAPSLNLEVSNEALECSSKIDSITERDFILFEEEVVNKTKHTPVYRGF